MAAGNTATYFDWTYDTASGKFMRGTEGKAHLIENAGQIGMKNVIVQFTTYAPTQYRDRADSEVDEANTVGSGDAWILSDGKIVRGHWSRATDADITTYTDDTGAPVQLEPRPDLGLHGPARPTQLRPLVGGCASPGAERPEVMKRAAASGDITRRAGYWSKFRRARPCRLR